MSRREPGRRIDADVVREAPFEIIVDGAAIVAYPGESVAAAMAAAGHRHGRLSARHREPRGYYCGMGLCWECVVVIDGHPNRRACTTLATPGMRIERRSETGPPGVS